jgi:hypothetical protein
LVLAAIETAAAPVSFWILVFMEALPPEAK